MHQENSRDGSRSWAPHVWALGIGGLWAAAALVTCGTLRAEPCAAVHERVLEELRSSDGTARYVLDPWACEQNARTLHQLAEELHKLEIRDETLRVAVEAYRAEMERLSKDYEHLAAAYLNSDGLSPQEAQRVKAALSQGVLKDSAAMNALRTHVQHACEL